MAALEKIESAPGIFKRITNRGELRYVVTYWVDGRQRQETCRTLKEARKRKAARTTDRDRGELFEASRLPFREYADEWIDRYQGNGRSGFREDTREDYRRDLRRYAYPFFSERLGRTLGAVDPRDVAKWIAWLCDEKAQGRRLADATVRRIVSPVRACFATARREGLIRHSPIDGAALPHRPQINDESEDVRALSREQLATLLRVVHPDWRLFFELLAATGLRWGEAAALRWRDLQLDGSEPSVGVRRALGRIRRQGDPPAFKPPKSKYGRRTVPLDAELVSGLRGWHKEAEWSRPDDLIFPARNGQPLRQENVRRRTLEPAAEEAGAGWAGFHAFRHTYASMHIARGTNIVQLSRLLGHHSPEFTYRVYAHLIPGDEPAALDLGNELAGAIRPNVSPIHGTATGPTEPNPAIEKTAV